MDCYVILYIHDMYVVHYYKACMHVRMHIHTSSSDVRVLLDNDTLLKEGASR